MGTTVGFVSGRTIVVFLLRGHNCRVWKWQENRFFFCCVGTTELTVGFVSSWKITIFFRCVGTTKLTVWFVRAPKSMLICRVGTIELTVGFVSGKKLWNKW